MSDRTPLDICAAPIRPRAKVWACFPCSDVKSHMMPDAWHASIRQTPYWWTTPELFERQHRPTIRRSYDPRFIACTATVIGIAPRRGSYAATQDASPDMPITPDDSTPELAAAESRSGSRVPTVAELEAIFRVNGTSIEELERRVLALSVECIKRQGRPVQTDDIVACIEKQEPGLLGILELIDQARALEPKTGKGKRLTAQQRERILAMLSEGTPVREIADQLGVSCPAIYAYKTGRIRAMSKGG